MKLLLSASAIALFALLAPLAHAQIGTDTVSQGEFPALQMLPPGSVVKDISLPRYVGPRVASLFRAAELKILSRSDIQLSGTSAELYNEGGEITRIAAPTVHYSFRTEQAKADGTTSVTDPRFTAKGSGVIFSSTLQCGLLRGPVHTTVNTQYFTSKGNK